MKFVSKLRLILSKAIQNSIVSSQLINEKMTQVVDSNTPLNQLDDVTVSASQQTKNDKASKKDLNNNEETTNLAPNKDEDKNNSETELIDLIESNLKLVDKTNKPISKLLEPMDISGAAKYLLKCKNVIFMTGAGISTSVRILKLL